ncbi:venom metalloproteinase antarease-like TpachMP_B [Dermacentor andersoni]|uniref:venom metalloproteinase antarease-like TpachMP_B n=1 Tax=Dermacentor andersoni TaxID=34620 RepID=UPI003B3AE2B9
MTWTSISGVARVPILCIIIVLRLSRASTTFGTIETGLVVSSEYASIFKGTEDHEYKSLLEYLRVFFSAVNVILGNTQKETLDIRLVISAIVILTEETEILIKTYPGHDDLIEAATPDALFDFMSLNGHLFADLDIALYLSKLKYAMPYGGNGRFRRVRGMAYAGAACSSFSGALIYDDGKLEGLQTAAHEVLHLLGSQHDGQPAIEYIPNSPGAEDCPDNPQYVMAANPTSERVSLSNCTRDQVLAFLQTPEAACLLNTEPRRSLPIFEALLRKPLLNASKYCNYRYKDAATVEYMPNYNSDYNIEKCYLVCMTIDSNGEKEYKIDPAPDYTPCSETSKQVCIKGLCRDIPTKGKPFHQQVKELANRRLISDLAIDE